MDSTREGSEDMTGKKAMEKPGKMLSAPDIWNRYSIYFYMFLVIALSNTVYFGMVKRKIFLIAAAAAILIGGIWMVQKMKNGEYCGFQMKNIFICLAFSLLIFFGWLFSGELSNSSFRNNYIGFLIVFFLALTVTMLFQKEQIISVYINYMAGISIVSLVCFVIVMLFPDFVPKIPMRMSEEGFFHSFYYTWGWDDYGKGLYIVKRNCGPFWEPGAFQGFLVVAILMSIKFGDRIKRADRKLVLFLVTLLTTLSTTGLLLFVLICIVWRKELTGRILKGRKNWKIVRNVLIVSFALILAWLLFSGIIFEKLATYKDPTVSTGIRFLDLVNGIGLCGVRPVFGMGFGTKLMDFYEESVGVSSNSNGLLVMFYAMGSIFGVLYLYWMSKGVIAFFEENGRIKKIVLVAVFVILQATECIFIFPVYLLFVYDYHYNEPGVNKLSEDLTDIRQRTGEILVRAKDCLRRIKEILRRNRNK